MRKVLVFAGTTEGRTICEYLVSHHIQAEACVASEYGEIVLPENKYLTIRVGRLDQSEMEQLLSKQQYDLVIDSTHPYASVVTENLRTACLLCETPYVRVVREHLMDMGEEAIFVDSLEEAAKYLNEHEGNALITTGSKLLKPYTEVKDYQKRLMFRVLPTAESMEACARYGISGKQIIGMQGPFSLAMNVAMLKEYEATYLVTKESGKIGGMEEKLKAARVAGAKVIVIRRPGVEQGIPLEELLQRMDQERKEW